MMAKPAALTAPYSLARRAVVGSVVGIVLVLFVAGLALATAFLRTQIEQSRIGALTQANVAASTLTAAVRFGGYDVISDALRVFDTGPTHDSAAVFDRHGRLLAQIVAGGEQRFPTTLSALGAAGGGFVSARPIHYPLIDDVGGRAPGTALATLVVTPNQQALAASIERTLSILGVTLALAAGVALWLAQRLVRAIVGPIAGLTGWAEQVAAAQVGATLPAAPRGGAIEVNRLIDSFESLLSQIAAQNRKLRRRQRELKHSNSKLENLAFSDGLTGLPNRTRFEATLATRIERANAGGRMFALLFIDLDQMKNINDQHGHAAGDAALRAAAARMWRAMRDGDFLARLGGDEFVLLTADGASPADATRLAERLSVWLGIAVPNDAWEQPLRASIGVAVFPDHGATVAALVQSADQAMYRAKAMANDEAIRVVGAAAPACAPMASSTSNVIALVAQERKSHSTKT